MHPVNKDTNQNQVGFLVPHESRRLSPRLRAINGVVVVALALGGFWLCNRYQIWNLGSGTVFHYFMLRFWTLIPITAALLPVAAYSIPLLYFQDRRQRNMHNSIPVTSEPRKLR
jgi:hypothetical protein